MAGGSAGRASPSLATEVTATDRRGGRPQQPHRVQVGWRLRAGPMGLATIALATIALALVPLLRQRGVPSWDTLWAEDATIFAAAVAFDSGLTNPLASHGGYFQLAPRLLAAALDVVPVRWWSEYVAFVGSFAAAVLAAFVYRASGSLIPSVSHRLVLASFVVAAPVLGFESTGNIANLHVLLVFAGAWAVLPSPGGRLWTVARSVVVGAAMLSSPVAVLVLPAVRWTAGRPRFTADRAVLGVAGLSAALQCVVALVSPGVDGMADVGAIARLPGLFVERVLGSALLGERFMVEAAFSLQRPFSIVLAGAGAAVAATWLVRWRALPARPATVFVLTGLGAYAMSLVLRADQFHQRGFGFGSRYAVVPVLLVSAAALILSSTDHRRSVRAGVPAWLVVLLITSFSVSTPRSVGPAWEDAVEAAASRCDAPGDIIEVAVPPQGWEPARFPCHAVLDGPGGAGRP